MSASPNEIDLLDAAERERATATFDRNLVVTAGAGTGKTTLLVDRLAHLLLRNPDPLRITEIVALTFTNKAANEMKLRLRERLQSYLAARLDQEPASDVERGAKREVASLIARYQLSKDDLDRRVHDALRNLERSDIGTIHSFAATLLRLYPLEAGIDPQFREDDGKQFDRLFDERWDLWLGEELTLKSIHAEQWRIILGKLALDQVKALAKSFANETVGITPDRGSSKTFPQALQDWLAGLEAKAAALSERHPEDRMNEKLARAALEVIRACRQSAAATHGDTETESLLREKSINRNLKGWSEQDVAEAQDLVRAARGLLQVDGELSALLWTLLVPFAETFRQFFVHQGFVSFDGLLIRARDLVRDHLQVRAELKRRYRSILIDEFQDTDPIQYEILLYLAEQQGRPAKDWREVRLTPGKVFVVGDPKQSIYAFRRADIEAYLEVVEKIIKAQDGIECRLITNFRSNAQILEVVNGIFTSLIEARNGIQPPYIAIHPAPGRSGASGALPKVIVRKIVAGDDELNAEKARRLEGESLALWLKDEILGKTAVLNARGEEIYAQPKDVALLFRKLTDIHDYLEPLRRQGIRYVVEGERHFYAAKEIIDAVNLLRAVENPHDRLALVGVLRSPLGGLTDRQIYDLHRENLLDYRKASGKKEFAPALTELYQTLARLHAETRVLPVGAAVAHIFASLPIKLLAACYFHGEQAVANLEKLRQQAELLGHEGLTTLKEAIRQLQERVLGVKEEGESVLAEENLDAVRIMSIHKAKGLEFPIVVLAGCQAGTEARQSAKAEALFDWSSGLTGMRVGALCDLAGLYITEKARVRAAEEQKRVLYVAMTRAREHLIVSCVPTGRRSGGSFLSMLDDCFTGELDTAEASKRVQIGGGAVDIQVVSARLSAPGRAKGKPKGSRRKLAWRPFIDRWTVRRERYRSIMNQPPFVTPTFLQEKTMDLSEAVPQRPRAGLKRTLALVVGDLAHRFLQNWELSADSRGYQTNLSAFIDRWLPDEMRPDRSAVEADLEEIFRGFFGSPAHAELAAARILGREVPLLMPWNGQIMEGVIDVIYERDGLLYLADYKTDRVSREELKRGAERYQQQAQIYAEAARLSLKREVAAFKLIFLRLGEAVEVKVAHATGGRFWSGTL
ncbi:MAG: UvrD-helicase domain-containing protein [Deltaproteobacteria bacterium]|nr:UvrD-helicase domain-containing protein [Deltaproteobacteria bacterium]